MKINNVFRYFLFFVCFFAIVYFETAVIAGIKFAYIWKFFVLGYFAFEIIRIKKGYFTVVKLSYFLALKQLLSIGSLIYITTSLIAVIRNLFLPVFTQFLIIKAKSGKDIEKLIIFFSASIIISGVPVFLNLVPAVNSDPILLGSYDVSLAGVEAFAGIFQGGHPASISIAISIICILFFFKTNHSKGLKIFFVFLILVGTYQLFLTFVRTGWLIFVIGALLLKFYNAKIKTIIMFLPALFILSFGVYYLYENNDAFRRRLIDEKDYEGSTDINWEDRFGSGRVSLAVQSINIWNESNLEEKFLGIGEKQFLLRMNNGEIFSHNGFINLLVNSGIVGIFIFFLILYEIMKLILYDRKSANAKLATIILISYLIYFSTLGGNLWFIELFLGLIIALLLVNKKEQNEKRIQN